MTHVNARLQQLSLDLRNELTGFSVECCDTDGASREHSRRQIKVRLCPISLQSPKTNEPFVKVGRFENDSLISCTTNVRHYSLPLKGDEFQVRFRHVNREFGRCRHLKILGLQFSSSI